MKYISSFMAIALLAMSVTANAGVRPTKDSKAKSQHTCSKNCSEHCGSYCHCGSGCCNKNK